MRAYPWMLEVYKYQGSGQLLAALVDQVIAPAEAKAAELRRQQGS